MDRDRLLALLEDYIECALTEADQDELEKLLLESVEARRFFWSYIQQHGLLHKIELETNGRLLAKMEPGAGDPLPTPPTARRRLGWRTRGALAASLAAALLLAWYGWQRPRENGVPPRPIDGRVDPAGGPALLATWLGGRNADAVGGVAIAPDGSVVVGATLPGADGAAWKPEQTSGEGDGVVLRLSPDGKRMLALLRRPGSVDDLRIDAAGGVYLIGSAGCAKLDAGLRTEWTADLKAPNGRIAPGPDGGAVILTDERLSVLDGLGKVRKQWLLTGRRVHDIVCDPVNRVVYATGSSVAGPKEGEIPFVYAFDLTGKRLWAAHDWTKPQLEAAKLTAGSVGLRLALDKDQQLYVAGTSHGGNTVWGRQSDNLGEPVPFGTDRYQNSYGVGSQLMTFVGWLDPRTGRVIQGTVLLGRKENGNGSSMQPSALAVDAEGRIYVGGWAGATPPISHGAFGLAGPGEGAFLCVFDHDFKRLYAARLCGGTTTAVASGGGVVAVAGRARDGLNTIAPLQAEPAGEEDGWLILFRKAPGTEYQSPIFEQPQK